MDFFDKAFFTTLLVIFWGVVGVAGWITVGSLTSSGEVDYCYVEMWSNGTTMNQFQLHGHRSWRPDRLVGSYTTLEETKAKADILGCKVGAR